MTRRHFPGSSSACPSASASPSSLSRLQHPLARPRQAVVAKIIPSDEFFEGRKKYIVVKYEYKPAIAHYVEPTDTSREEERSDPGLDTVAQRTVSPRAPKTLAGLTRARTLPRCTTATCSTLKGLVHA